MRDDDAQMLFDLFGGRSALVRSLSIESYSENDQRVVLEKFSTCLFKRMLLAVPEAHVGDMIDVIEIHRSTGKVLGPLVHALEAYIPDMESQVREEMDLILHELGTTANS